MTHCEVALITDDKRDEPLYEAALRANSIKLRAATDAAELPRRARALIVSNQTVARAAEARWIAILRAALAANLPILALGYGMSLLNIAAGAEARATAPKQPRAAAVDADADNDKTRVFIAPGSKLAHVVGGSGWLTMPQNGSQAMTIADLSPTLMASCYGASLRVYAFEKPGHKWIIGLNWRLLPPAGLPRGFDKIFNVFIEQAVMRENDDD